MPAKRKYKRKNKKRVSKIGRPPTKALSTPKPYFFKRTFSTVQELTANNGFWTVSGNNLAKTWTFNLNSMGSANEFQGLFKYYKLKGARVKMYFSNTGSNVTSATNPSVSPYAPNAQILVSIDRNMDGDTAGVADEQLYLQSQTVKRKLALRNDGKPLDLYMPLKQRVYLGGPVSGNPPVRQLKPGLGTPKWISTQDSPDIEHFGYNTLFQRVDGAGFTVGMQNAQSVRILTTLYFQCKKVE